MQVNERDELRWHSGRYSWLETRRGYSMMYEGALKGARGVIEKVNASVDDPAVPRDDEFREDWLIPRAFRSTLDDYAKSGFDRGHLCPSASRRENEVWQSDTFLLSNMSPQVPGFNRGPWRSLESRVRDLATEKDVRGVWCISLCLFLPKHPILTIGRNNVPVPHAYAKSVLAECDGGQFKLWNFSLANKPNTHPEPQNIEFLERWAGVPLYDRFDTNDKHVIQQKRGWW